MAKTNGTRRVHFTVFIASNQEFRRLLSFKQRYHLTDSVRRLIKRALAEAEEHQEGEGPRYSTDVIGGDIE